MCEGLERFSLISFPSEVFLNRKVSNFSTMISVKNKRKNYGATTRKKTLIKKARESGELRGFEVALFIHWQGQIKTFRSIDSES